MATSTSVTYNANILVGGPIKTDQAKLAADTYYPGMMLQYEPDVTVVAGTNTGTGTCTLDFAEAYVKAGAWVFEFTAALVAKLTDPDGNVVQNAIAVTNDTTTVLKIEGLAFTITDTATAFVSGDKFTLTVAAGAYKYKSNGKLAGIFYEPESRVLSSAAFGSIITGGEIMEGGLVTDVNGAVTLTDLDRAQFAQAGFYIKRK